MDNNQTNQPTQQTAPATPPVGQPASGGQPPTNIVQPASEGNNNKMILWLVGGLAVIILVFGGIYFYLNSQKKPQPTPAPTSTPKAQENLESELNSVEVDNLDAEFTSVDQDLQNL